MLILEALRKRKSLKWRTNPPDVLPAFVAEMHFDLAAPIIEAAAAALTAGGCGYRHPGELGEAFGVRRQAAALVAGSVASSRFPTS